jgi:outer membrane protein
MLTLCLVFFSVSTAFAAGSAFNVAFVDRQLVLDEYKETESIEQDLKKAQDDRQIKIDERKKALDLELKAFKELEEKKDPESEKKKEVMKAELEKKFAELKDLHETYMRELQTIEKKYVNTLKAKIHDAIKEVGKKNGYSVVLEKEAVYFGGKDITDDVVLYLNKK